MRTLLSRFRRALRRPEPVPPPVAIRPPNSGWYRAASCRRLTPAQIRHRQFRTVRRGLDPIEVYAHLHRIAGELAQIRQDLGTATEENTRIKLALRTWQSQFTPGGRW
ncbi:DivIVA domain-containing protein [Micromonospora sp. SH-82]|uniref:DivIVA domain-containing protein n=1 Tax=Micromonospora sp. SH-82 TaxID=3132938 RepID=UPI003EBEAF51